MSDRQESDQFKICVTEAAVEAAVSFLAGSGEIAWNKPRWVVRELVQDMLEEMHRVAPGSSYPKAARAADQRFRRLF